MQLSYFLWFVFVITVDSIVECVIVKVSMKIQHLVTDDKPSFLTSTVISARNCSSFPPSQTCGVSSREIAREVKQKHVIFSGSLHISNYCISNNRVFGLFEFSNRCN